MTDNDDRSRAPDDPTDDRPGAADDATDGPAADAPTVSCTRCDEEWTLTYELDSLQVGNQAVEQFALDHKRHTGHFPDDVSTWRANCRRCPEVVERLGEKPARRWARTHVRHTGHTVAVDHASLSEPAVVENKSE